jgi:hypothetical protein
MKGALLWLGLLGAGSAHAGDLACGAHYKAPHLPQRLTRTLIRDLSDGKQIVTSRSYLVTITRAGAGYRVDGKQVSVDVSSPPPLAALAAMERARVDHETLPILLDRDGHILPETEREAPSSPKAGAAVDAVQAQARMTPAERSTAHAVAHAMLAPGGHVITQWPDDVFNPAPGKREEVLHPALPDGTQGEVMITIAGACGKGGAVHLDRDVVTRIGESARHTHESWALEPAGNGAKR